jgi:group I intron endonuclease
MYIGVSKNPKKRFRSHGWISRKGNSAMKLAMQKHGVENFKMEILVEGSQEYCYALEETAINSFNTLSPCGYNISTGGRGGFGLFGEKNGAYGRTGPLHPHYGNHNMSRGRKHSEETKAKMSASRTGLKRSLEFKEKMSQIALNRSPELKAKMCEARNMIRQKAEV